MRVSCRVPQFAMQPAHLAGHSSVMGAFPHTTAVPACLEQFLCSHLVPEISEVLVEGRKRLSNVTVFVNHQHVGEYTSGVANIRLLSEVGFEPTMPCGHLPVTARVSSQTSTPLRGAAFANSRHSTPCLRSQPEAV